MAVPTMVQCVACARPYAARLVEGEYILPTSDGTCACGGDAFVEVTERAR